MSRYIDAENIGLTNFEIFTCNGDYKEALKLLLLKIENAPTADVVERKRAEWVSVTNGRGGFECSECHSYAPSYQNGDDNLSNYCSNCGADMRDVKVEGKEK